MLIAYVIQDGKRYAKVDDQEALILVGEYSLEERNSFVERNKKAYAERHPETRGKRAGKYARVKWSRKVLGKNPTARTAKAGGADSKNSDVHLHQQKPGDDNR